MSAQFFSTVAEWKREAARENSEKYFFPFRDLGRVETGESCFVIGRKGTGKTAIAEHLEGQSGHDRFCEALSFKSFPFHLLYALKDDGYSSKSKYISLWKFVIYSSVCKMMAKNEAIDSTVRDLLQKKFPIEPKEQLRSVLASWITRSFGVQILGTGGTFSTSKAAPISNEGWHKELTALSEIVRAHLDDCQYLITFDALDDDYQEMLNADQRSFYLSLITSLFKAIDDVRNEINTNGRRLFPIAFLRDDIFDQLEDSDRNKWEDIILRLTWNRDSLQRMLAHRLSRAENSNGPILPFDEAWGLLFTNQLISPESDSPKLTMFFYLMQRTYNRPRDFIVYLARCAKVAAGKGLARVDSKHFLMCEPYYSEYFRQELQDELTPVVPDVIQVFAALSNMARASFTLEAYIDSVAKLSKSGAYDPKKSSFPPEKLMQILFLFNVVGNRTSRGRRIFKFADPDENLNLNQAITIHPGLWKSFNIN